LATKSSLPASFVGPAMREAEAAMTSAKTQQMRFNNISEVVDFLQFGKNPLIQVSWGKFGLSQNLMEQR
jgi:hypothetical protein